MTTSVTYRKANDKHQAYKTETRRINELSDSTLMDIDDFDKAYVLRLTKAALIAGNIPNDDSIVPFIGEGHEEDNSKAVENWIKNHIEMLINIAPQNQIEKIIEEIDNRLQEVKTGYISSK